MLCSRFHLLSPSGSLVKTVSSGKNIDIEQAGCCVFRRNNCCNDIAYFSKVFYFSHFLGYTLSDSNIALTDIVVLLLIQ